MDSYATYMKFKWQRNIRKDFQHHWWLRECNLRSDDILYSFVGDRRGKTEEIG